MVVMAVPATGGLGQILNVGKRVVLRSILEIGGKLIQFIRLRSIALRSGRLRGGL